MSLRIYSAEVEKVINYFMENSEYITKEIILLPLPMEIKYNRIYYNEFKQK
jgi:hypothetical protein